MDTTSFTSAVAESVDHLMEEVGESLLSLSTKTGIARTTLRRRIAGQTSFTIRELELVAIALGTTVDNLIPKDHAA